MEQNTCSPLTQHFQVTKLSVTGSFFCCKTIRCANTTVHSGIPAFHIFMLLYRLFSKLSLSNNWTVNLINMKKRILIILVMAGWFILKNGSNVTALANNSNSIDKKAMLLAKHVQQQFQSFTTVHLFNIKIKTNSCKQPIKTLPLQACREIQRINHETLLTINSL